MAAAEGAAVAPAPTGCEARARGGRNGFLTAAECGALLADAARGTLRVIPSARLDPWPCDAGGASVGPCDGNLGGEVDARIAGSLFAAGGWEPTGARSAIGVGGGRTGVGEGGSRRFFRERFVVVVVEHGGRLFVWFCGRVETGGSMVMASPDVGE